jgi:hypothetical protein
MLYTLNLVGILLLFINVVLPLLVALVTRSSTPSSVKGVLLLALSAVSVLLTQWYDSAQAGEVIDWKTTLYNAVIAFVIAVASYFGLWRPTQVRARLQAIGDPKSNVRRVA